MTKVRERIAEAHTFVIDLVCLECRKGTLSPRREKGEIYSPTGWLHTCSNDECGAQVECQEVYPKTVSKSDIKTAQWLSNFEPFKHLVKFDQEDTAND